MSKLDTFNSLKKLNDALEKLATIETIPALLKTGYFVQAGSQKLAPVDTGFLRNSAHTEVEGDSVVIAYDAEYSAYQHEGTDKFEGRFFITKFIDENEERIEQVFIREFLKYIKKAVNNG